TSPRTITDPAPPAPRASSTIAGLKPSRTAGAVPDFTPPGPIRVLDAQDYYFAPLDEGVNKGKLLLIHKTTGKTEGLFKPASRENTLTGSKLGIKAGERYRRAPAAAYLAREAGIATPAAEIVVWREQGKADQVGSLQEWSTEGTEAIRFSDQDYQTINRSQ